MPSSATVIRIRSPAVSMPTETGRPPPYFTALDKRFTRTCSMRRRSQEPSRWSAPWMRSSVPTTAAGSRKSSATCRTNCARSKLSGSSSSRPAATRDTSRSRSIRCESRSVCRSAPPRRSSTLPTTFFSRSIALSPRSRLCSLSCNAVSGVRSSCAATEMNSSRSRSASRICAVRTRSLCAPSSASRTCCSIRSRSIAAARTFATDWRK